MDDLKPKSVALVHDWLTGWRGGEKCLEVLAEIFPNAPIYTLIYIPSKINSAIKNHSICSSWLNYIPWVAKIYRYLLPLFPIVIRQFKLDQYDLIVSSSHCVAKSIKVHSRSIHLCYCFTPMRYLWGFEKEYFGDSPNPILRFLRCILFYFLKRFDVAASHGVDCFFSISHHIAERIKIVYQRESITIYPPVDTDFYHVADIQREDYYLLVSALVPYKKIDMIIEAFNELGYPLKIIGAGPLASSLKQMAKNNIEFLGWVSDDELRQCYQRCKTLVFAAEEDFGIVLLEAQACGAPVVAYGRGGALETIENGITGMWFAVQSMECLKQAILESEKVMYNPIKCRENALRFSRQRFIQEIRQNIQEQYMSIKKRKDG